MELEKIQDIGAGMISIWASWVSGLYRTKQSARR